MNIGFIGLGHIGRPMAVLWAQSKQPMMVFDTAPQATADLTAAGATAASSVAELARGSQLIGICVRDDKQVESVLSGPGGILENAQPGTLVLVHSTVKQQSIFDWHERARAKKIDVVDASVTRATRPNSFCYMVGGDASILERCRSTLTSGGNTVVHAGPLGSGIALKLCNNTLTYSSFVAIHEAYKLARAFGIDPELMHQVSVANGVLTPSVESFIRMREQVEKQSGKAAMVAAFAPHGANGNKDMRAALESAKKMNVTMPGGEKVDELINEVFVNGY